MSDEQSPDPKVFISYSWSNDDHVAWVENLARTLIDNGVDVILDQWEVRPGHALTPFMERMKGDQSITHVLLVCDAKYREKADGRAGGAGTEAQIISKEVYNSVTQVRYVPIVREYDESGPCIPIFVDDRLYIDFSETSINWNEALESLLRHLYGKPRRVKPKLGKRPAFLDDQNDDLAGPARQLQVEVEQLERRTSALHPRAVVPVLDTMRNLVRSTMLLTPATATQWCDELDPLLPRSERWLADYRRALGHLARNQNDDEWGRTLHDFFEKLRGDQQRPADDRSGHSVWAFDFQRFLALELFLHTVSVLVGHQRERVAQALFRRYMWREHSNVASVDYTTFDCYCEGLEKAYGSLRANGKRLSIVADLLKERAERIGGPAVFEDVMQADLLCVVRASVDELRGDADGQWWGRTLLYARHHGQFLYFAKAARGYDFRRLAQLMETHRRDQIIAAIVRVIERQQGHNRWERPFDEWTDLQSFRSENSVG